MLEQLSDGVRSAEPTQTGRGEQHGVEPSVVVDARIRPADPCQSGVDVAADVDDREVGPGGPQLRHPPRGTGAHPRPGRKCVDREAVPCAQGITRIRALRHGADAQARVRNRRQVFEGVDDDVALTGDEGVAQGGREHARAAQ